MNFDNERQNQGMIQQHLGNWDAHLYLMDRTEVIKRWDWKPCDGWYLTEMLKIFSKKLVFQHIYKTGLYKLIVGYYLHDGILMFYF